MCGFPFRPSRRSLAGGIATSFIASAAVQAAPVPAQSGMAAMPVMAIPSLRGSGGLEAIDVSALPGGASVAILAEGYWQLGDGGGGRFYWDAEAADPIDDLLVFAPRPGRTRGRWRRLADPFHLTFEMAGARGDGVADDFEPCQKVLRIAGERFRQCRVLLQPGKPYLLDHHAVATTGFGLRLTSPNAGALVVPNHCVIQGPGGALGVTAQTLPGIGIAPRLVLP